MLTTILQSIQRRGAAHTIRRSRHSAKLGDLPPGLSEHWARTAGLEFNGIPNDALFFARASEALMDFFDCVAFTGQPCALPSRAADSVWHAWLRYSPMTLQQFTLKHFGRLIPHLAAQDMRTPMDASLATCLVGARRIAGQVPAGSALPPLFTADQRLRMPHGYAYKSVGERVGVARTDARGRPLPDISFPPSLAPAGLLAAGLVTEQEIAQARRQAANRNDDGGSSGNTSHDRDRGDGDSGGSESGSGGDSSCGSGCGGD